MKVGFAAPVSGSWATPENLAQIARRAEELGYDSLWTFQRLLSPVDASWGETYRSVLDPVATLAYLAGLTSRIRLGVAVVNMPFFAPVLLAKQLATLDIVSGGRLDAGLGLGWSPEEFTATGGTLRRRGERAEEYIALLKAFWTQEIIDHTGEFYEVPASRMDPKPVQKPHPPLLIGAKTAPALRRAGRLCDGWVSSSGEDLSAAHEAIATVKSAAEEAGRDPSALRFVCRGARLARELDKDLGGGFESATPARLERQRETIGWLGEQGFTEVFIDLNFDPAIGSPDVDAAAAMERAMEVVEGLAPTP